MSTHEWRYVETPTDSAYACGPTMCARDFAQSSKGASAHQETLIEIVNPSRSLSEAMGHLAEVSADMPRFAVEASQ